jgi:hypothetical protein
MPNPFNLTDEELSLGYGTKESVDSIINNLKGVKIELSADKHGYITLTMLIDEKDNVLFISRNLSGNASFRTWKIIDFIDTKDKD